MEIGKGRWKDYQYLDWMRVSMISMKKAREMGMVNSKQKQKKRLPVPLLDESEHDKDEKSTFAG